MSDARFYSFKSSFSLEFWKTACELKLKETKLSEEPIPIRPVYDYSFYGRHPYVYYDVDSFVNNNNGSQYHPMHLNGAMVICNTLRKYSKLCNDLSPYVHKFNDFKDIGEFVCAYVIAYLDLKTYEVHYRCAYPTLRFKSPIKMLEVTDGIGREIIDLLQRDEEAMSEMQSSYKRFINQGGDYKYFAIKVDNRVITSISQRSSLMISYNVKFALFLKPAAYIDFNWKFEIERLTVFIYIEHYVI
ncbi:hypothetical protein ACOME3_009533 [Neoechinorhynchus agilis]